YEMTTGATALSESLALRRLLAQGTADRGPRTIDVHKLPGVTVPEHPWGRMTAGNKPEPEPLAGLVPHDQYYLTFRSAAALVSFADLLDEWGGLVVSAFEVRGRDYRLRQRYEKQLCLDGAALARTLDPLLLRGVAVTGGDPYLRQGSDLTVIFHVSDRKAMLAALAPFVEKARKEFGAALRETKEDYGGGTIESFVAPRREVSLHRASFDEFVVCSNSPAALRRILDVYRGKIPPLSRSSDFRTMRTVFRRGDGKEDGFAFLSDAFIRRLVGPAMKIKEKRRLEAMASLSLLTNGALFAAWETGRLPRDHKGLMAAAGLKPADVAVPEGPPAAWDAAGQVAVADAYNTLHFATPLVELPIDRVTSQEARDYEMFRQQYMGLWRRFYDPVGLRFTLEDRRIRAEAFILPLVGTSAYNLLRTMTGGKTVAIDSATFSPRTVFAFLAHVDNVGPFQLRLDDGPGLRELVGVWMRRELQPLSEEAFHREADAAMARVPLSFTLRVPDAKEFANQLKMVQDALPGWEPGTKVETLAKPHRGATISHITIPRDGTLARVLREHLPEPLPGFLPGFYHALDGDVWYVSVSEDALRKLIDEGRERRADKTVPKKEDREVSSAVNIVPAAGKDALGALSLLLEWETHRRAVGNGPVWHALYRAGVLAPDADGPAREAAALRFLGFVPVSPDGSPYRYDRAADEVVSVRHGSPRRPDVHAAPDEKSPLLLGLTRLRAVRADLTFCEDGVQTVVTIDRATPAEGKAERSAPGAAIRRLGGRVVIDERDPARPVVRAELRGSGAGDGDLAALRGLDAMREIDLGSTRVTDAGLAALHDLAGLRRVYLDGTAVTDAGADALRKAVPGVEVIRWTDAEQRLLAAVARLGGRRDVDPGGLPGQILRIDLAGTPADDETLAVLEAAESLGWLDLTRTAVTDKGLTHLRGLKKLRRVYLGKGVTDGGAGALRKAVPGVEVIRWTDAEQRLVDAVVRLGGKVEAEGDEKGPVLRVSLAGTRADDGLAHLKPLTRLRTLTLCGTEVSDRGMAHLTPLKKLTELNVVNTRVTAAGVREVRAALPKVSVDR
ncbi:MAG TPA: hypothetical protein VFW33_12905, partial [Gemmataceae bacterium]|nr:hypothetical protein [Gemmataceae bacterium]